MTDPIQPTNPVPPSQTHTPTLFFLLIAISILASLIVGIQIGKNQFTSQQSAVLIPTTYPTPQPVVPTSDPTPTLQIEKYDPQKIVENIKKAMNLNKNIPVNQVNFSWLDDLSKNGTVECADNFKQLAGYGFTVNNLTNYKGPVSIDRYYPGSQESGCNNAVATIKGRNGYIIGNVVCVWSGEAKTLDGPATVSFVCGNNLALQTQNTSTPDPIIALNNYSNKVHNVSFKYPQTWKLDSKNDQEPINAGLTLTKGEAKITIFLNMDGIGGGGQSYKGTELILDGNKVFLFKESVTRSSQEILGVTSTLVNSLGVFEIKDKTYSIRLSYPSTVDASTGSNLEKEFQQMLSTFKFSP